MLLLRQLEGYSFSRLNFLLYVIINYSCFTFNCIVCQSRVIQGHVQKFKLWSVILFGRANYGMFLMIIWFSWGPWWLYPKQQHVFFKSYYYRLLIFTSFSFHSFPFIYMYLYKNNVITLMVMLFFCSMPIADVYKGGVMRRVTLCVRYAIRCGLVCFELDIIYVLPIFLLNGAIKYS